MVEHRNVVECRMTAKHMYTHVSRMGFILLFGSVHSISYTFFVVCTCDDGNSSRDLDSHTTETRGTDEAEESPQPVLELSASKSNWLHKLSTMWKSSSGLSKRTVAPNRPLGQYFLDLGQRDFSCSTCPSCGLVYARGEETDEKLHASFHKSQLQGIQFRVKSSFSLVWIGTALWHMCLLHIAANLPHFSSQAQYTQNSGGHSFH